MASECGVASATQQISSSIWVVVASDSVGCEANSGAQ